MADDNDDVGGDDIGDYNGFDGQSQAKQLVFRVELIVLLLLQICFFFVMKEISLSLFT